MRRTSLQTIRPVLLALAAASLNAQPPLTLKDAIGMALDKHPSVKAAKAGEQEAEMRIKQAKGGYYPKLNYQESYQRGNNPVFVFSSLLTQRQFTAANFDIARLNNPDAMNNFQSQMIVDQMLYDAGMTKHSMNSAGLMERVAGEEKRRNDMDVIFNVVRAYSGTLLAQESLRVAGESVKSAEADLKRAEAVRAAGMATDADVLSIRVHLASVREQQIRAANDLSAGRATLNEALGLPLDSQFDLTTPLASSPAPALKLSEFEKRGAEERPEARQMALATNLVSEQRALAKAAYLPQVSFRALVEADRQQFVTKGGANWFTGLTLRWNLFNGMTDKARIEETSLAAERAAAQKQRAENGIRLQVRKAHLDLGSAGERIEVARSAVTMAEESHRIIQNRYENGLTTVTELLRSETALAAARLRHLAAVHDQRVATASLLQAAGILNQDSEL